MGLFVCLDSGSSISVGKIYKAGIIAVRLAAILSMLHTPSGTCCAPTTIYLSGCPVVAGGVAAAVAAAVVAWNLQKAASVPQSVDQYGGVLRVS